MAPTRFLSALLLLASLPQAIEGGFFKKKHRRQKSGTRYKDHDAVHVVVNKVGWVAYAAVAWCLLGRFLSNSLAVWDGWRNVFTEVFVELSFRLFAERRGCSVEKGINVVVVYLDMELLGSNKIQWMSVQLFWDALAEGDETWRI